MTATPFVDHYAQAAQRAYAIAGIARDRFAPPETLLVLGQIARHLDQAGAFLDALKPGAYVSLPVEATEALWLADTLAEDHPATRFPIGFTNYVLQPLTDRSLPFPDPLFPVTDRFGRQEADLVHALHQLHGDNKHQWERTDHWLCEVFTVWQKHMRLADEVRVDNARPCNQH
ncbi:hypothetical protein [Streptomyces sp. NPDC059455]|uniref:hypothetical protein n=1 Tax=Streptomyces sp. NPDC059455 TaxID=3346837 RepID=UPI0036BD6C62